MATYGQIRLDSTNSVIMQTGSGTFHKSFEREVEKAKPLNHSSVKQMTKIIMGACVLHNFALVHDDFLEDDDDDDDFGGCDGFPRNRPAEQKRQHLLNLVAG